MYFPRKKHGKRTERRYEKMKVIAILAVALLMGSLVAGFAMAQGAETSDATKVNVKSADSIGVNVVFKAPNAASAGVKADSTGSAVASKKPISPVSVGAARAVNAEKVVKATPAIPANRVEETYNEVLEEAQELFPDNGKKPFGFAVAVSGPGSAISANGITKQLQVMTVSQTYVNDDGSNAEEVSKGTLVVADTIYGLQLKNVEANKKQYSLVQAGVEVGELDVVEEPGLINGDLTLNGEVSSVEILTEENPLKLETSNSQQISGQSNVVAKVVSWFKGLFSRG